MGGTSSHEHHDNHPDRSAAHRDDQGYQIEGVTGADPAGRLGPGDGREFRLANCTLTD
jgi:hypothetical protein